MNDTWLVKLEKNLKEKRYRKGELVYRTGDRGTIYIVKTGRVEFYYLDKDGHKYIIDYLKSNDIFGDMQVDFAVDIYAEAAEESIILSIKTELFFSKLKDDYQSAVNLLHYFIKRLFLAYHKSASMAVDNVFVRLVKLLIYLGGLNEAGADGKLVTDKYTHEQLSQMLGVSRQIVTTMLNDLEKKQAIVREKKRFIFNKSKLQTFIP